MEIVVKYPVDYHIISSTHDMHKYLVGEKYASTGQRSAALGLTGAFYYIHAASEASFTHSAQPYGS